MGGMRVLRWWSRAFERGEDRSHIDAARSGPFVLFCGKLYSTGRYDMAALIKAFSNSFTWLLFYYD
jgi:hypothetical protein